MRRETLRFAQCDIEVYLLETRYSPKSMAGGTGCQNFQANVSHPSCVVDLIN